MKYLKSSLWTILPFLAIVACSDDKSPTLGGEDPSDDSSSSFSNVNVGPITSHDYKPSAPQTYSVNGFAGMGPFVTGSKVDVFGLDVATMSRSPEALSGVTKDNNGTFSINGTITSSYGLMEATGKYYDFFLDDTGCSVSLSSIFEFKGQASLNVNVLTTLAQNRIVYLIREQGMPFDKAKAQAEKEVLAAFALEEDSTPFEEISIFGDSQATGNLVVATSLLMKDFSCDEVNANIQAISADLADGKWDDPSMKVKIADHTTSLDKYSLFRSLEDLAGLDRIGARDYFKNNFFAEVFGLGECSSANSGATAVNKNEDSQKFNVTFKCSGSSWTEVSAAAQLSAEVSKTFGECTSSNEGILKVYTDNRNFICKKNLWLVASAEDVVAAKVAEINGACTQANSGKSVSYESSYFLCVGNNWRKLAKKPVDYSKGRAMNKKLGKGINFGNSWDSPGSDDGGWGNRIADGDFATVKKAGFNSVRIPVRWYTGMDSKLSGVKADVQLAINAGLVVIVNSHHNEPIYAAAKNGSLSSKLNDFKNEWKRIAETFNSFADDKIVFEIFNEPHDMTQDQVNQIMTAGYEAIRSVTKTKTIMFEGNGWAKLGQIPKLNLPDDGNIIVSGHYYEPYTFTHQGYGDDYPCNANAASNSAAISGMFKGYRDSIMVKYPDINGGSVPINVGEFGVANKGRCQSVSDANRAAWTKAVVEAAENNDMSWHYWCFKNCGGFEASNGSSWYSGMLNAFKLSN